jgi:iron(III) transport system ATP-binding protein
MSHVRLHELEKSFNKIPVVRQLTLEIQEGEFFSLLGPSGCGKTTTLRMIAGFETPERGSIFFNSEEVTWRKPSARNTGMVFQNYALFPHLSVFENIAFGLKARKAPVAEIQTRVQEALQLVEMAGMGNRPVTQLSGGQQQRVALARALAIRPAILLLDEPLSNLDAQLRKSTRAELKSLQRQLGITAIYVTHDQEEALALSDRMAVMHHGVLQQVGTPQDIYNTPQNLFVMNFIGSCNVLRGRIAAKNAEQILIAGDGWQLPLPIPAHQSRMVAAAGSSTHIAFRPEHARVTRGTISSQIGNEDVVLPGVWQSAEFAGTHWLIHTLVSGTHCSARMAIAEAASALGANYDMLPAGESIALHVPIKNVMLFDKDS